MTTEWGALLLQRPRSRLASFFVIIILILLSVNTAISECLISENLKGIDETSGLKVSFTTGDAYLTAGSNVYKLNNPVPFDTLENGSFYQIYKTKAGLFLVTDKHLRVSGSTSQMTIVKGIPHVDSLINIYGVKDETLLNFSEGLYLYDENNFSSKILQSGKDRIVNSCVVANDDGFVAAIGNQIFSLVREQENVKLEPIVGFTGFCNDLKSTQKGLILSSYEGGFYKYNSTNKHFEIIPSPDASPIAAGGIISVNGHVLLSTTSALYHINEKGQMELIENVGSLKNAYARPENIILHSLKGLFLWDGQQAAQAIPGFQSELFHLFNSEKAIIIQKAQELFMIENKIPEKISLDSSLKSVTGSAFKILSILDSESGLLLATNVGVLHIALGSKVLKRLPGSPETPVEQLFKNKQDIYAVSGHQLFKVLSDPIINKEVFADIVWPKSTSPMDKLLTVQYKLNTQGFPCTSDDTWFEHWLELSGDGKEPEKISAQVNATSDSNKINPSFTATINIEELAIPSFSISQQRYEMAIVGKTFSGQSVRILNQKKIIVGKTLSERASDFYNVLYDNKSVIAFTFIFLMLILARYFEWCFNFCFNMLSGTPFEKINKWTRPLLRISFYRRWIFRRYFDYMKNNLGNIKNTPELAIYFKKTNKFDDGSIQLDELLSLFQRNRKNIWINDDSNYLSSTFSDILKRKCFFDKPNSKSWCKYPCIPIFISAKSSTINDANSWIVDRVEEVLVKAKVDFKDTDFFKTILKSGEFIIIIEGLDDTNEEIQSEIMQYSTDTRSARLLIISKITTANINVTADQFDIYHSTSMKSG